VTNTDEADVSSLTPLTAAPSDTGCPEAHAGDCETETFTIPNPFAAGDTNAACPVSVPQENAGILGCGLAVVNNSLSPVSEAIIFYGATLASPPTNPTLVANHSYLLPGDSVSLTGGGYWGNAIQDIQALELSTTPDASPTTCGVGGGYGDVPTALLEAFWVPTTGSPTATSASTIDITNDCYNGTTLNGPSLTGSLTVPALAAGSYQVAVCEVNPYIALFASGANDSAGVCTGGASDTTFTDAESASITIGGGTTAVATPNNGSEGNTIGVAGTNFDPQGATPTIAFTAGGTPDSGTCGAVQANGDVSCSITVGNTTNEPAGSDPIQITQGSLNAQAAFSVNNLHLSCSILDNATETAPTSCEPNQVITVVVNGNPAVGITISETNAFVVLTPITLDGANQPATGALNELTVDDDTGIQPGWTVTAAFEAASFACAATVGAVITDCSGNVADTAIPITNFGWAPALNAANTTSDTAAGGIVAGATVAPGAVGAVVGGFTGDVNPSPGNPDTTAGTTQTLCSAAPGNSGGQTACDAGVTLEVPAYASAGTYSNTLDITLSAG
jgi:hypothetical protein